MLVAIAKNDTERKPFHPSKLKIDGFVIFLYNFQSNRALALVKSYI